MHRSRPALMGVTIIAFTFMLLSAVGVPGCAIRRIDFNAYLDRAVGNPLRHSDFDSAVNGAGGRRLVAENDAFQTYRYQLTKSDCAWEVDVLRPALVVLRWRYVSDAARDACNDLPARRGV